MSHALDEATVRRMVRHLRPAWTVRGATLIEEGTDAVSFVTIDTPEGPLDCVLKACTMVPPEDFRPEPYLMRLLRRETAVPTPRVYGAVDDHDDCPAPYFLMARCDGVRADEAALDDEAVERLARAAGRFAGEYHRLATFDRFGYVRLDTDLADPGGGVTVDGRTLGVDDAGDASWRDWVEGLYEGWITDLDERFADLRPDIEAFVESRLDALDRPFDAVLGHIDYKPWNVLVDPATAETTAVLDWGHATAMTPEYDLLLTEEHLSRWAPLDSPRRRRVREAIEAGYAETSRIERDEGFARRRELYLVVSRLQPLVCFSEWTAEDPPEEREAAAARHRRVVTDLVR